MKNGMRYIGFMVVCLAAVFMPLCISMPVAHAQVMIIQQLRDAYQAGMSDEQKAAMAQRLKAEIERREHVVINHHRCGEPIKVISGFLASEVSLDSARAQLGPAYVKLSGELKEKINGPFNKLIEEFETLKANAARAGVLVSDEDWATYRSRRGKGVLTRAVLADPNVPGLAAKVKRFRDRRARIVLAMYTMSNNYKSGNRDDLKKIVGKANKAWNERLNDYDALYRKEAGFEKQIRELFRDPERRYEHCLGEIAGKADHNASGFHDPGLKGTELYDIPGMQFTNSFPVPATIKETYKAFTVPDALPPLPPPLHFFKDPLAPQRFAKRAEARLEGARYMLAAEAIEGPRYIAEVASHYNPLSMLKGIVHPLRHFLNPAEKPGEVLTNVGKEYTYDTANGIYDAGKGLLEESGKADLAVYDAFEKGLDGLVNNPKSASEVFKDVMQGADEALGKVNAALQGANPMYDPERPAADASPEAWLQYTDEINALASSAEDALAKAKEATEWFKAHVVDNANRALTVFLAARAGAETFEAAGGGLKGILKAGQSLTGTDLLENLHGNLKGIKAFGEKGWKGLNEGTTRIKTILEKNKKAREIVANAGDELSPPEGLGLADKKATSEDLVEDLKNLAAREKTESRLAEIQEKAREQVDNPEPPPGRETSVRETIEVLDKDGNPVTLKLGNELGKGGGSQASVNAKNNAYVVRRTELTPNGKRANAHDELGREILETDFNDSPVIRVAKREAVYSKKAGDPLDPFAGKAEHVEIVENLSPERGFVDVGKLKEGPTPGQKLAIERAHRALNAKGEVWLDDTPANYRLEKLPGEDRWRVVVLDPGGIYKIKGGDPARAAEAQKIFDKKMKEVVEQGNEGQGGYMNVAIEFATKDIEFKLPEGVDSPAFAVKQRLDTGLKGLTADEINARGRLKEKDAMEKQLGKDSEYPQLKAEQKAAEKADKKTTEILAKAEQKLETPGERLAKKEEQLRKEAAENIARRQQEQARAQEPFVEIGKVQVRGGGEQMYGGKIGEGSIKDVYAGKNPDEVIQIYKGNKEDAIEALNREVATDMRLDRAGVPFVKTKNIMFTKDGKIVKVVERINPENELGKVLRKQDGMFNREQTAAILELRDKVANAGMVGTDMSPANLDFIRDKTGRLQARVIDKDALVNVDELIRDRIRDGKETTITIKNTKKVKVDGRDRIQLVKGEEKFDLTRPEDIKRLQNLAMFGSNGELKGAYSVGTARQLMKELKPDSFDVLPVWGGTGAYRSIVPNELVSSSPAQLEGMLEQGRKTALAHEITTGSLKEKNEALQKAKAEQEKLERERHLYLSNYKKQGEEKGDIPDLLLGPEGGTNPYDFKKLPTVPGGFVF